MTSQDPYYSSSYSEADTRFLGASLRRGGQHETHLLPDLTAPDGGALNLRTLRIGSDKPDTLLVILSGVHGVEGYLGSAVQLALIDQAPDKIEDNDTALLLVHAVNPYGFAHDRRANEDNVDLNRNFIDFSRPIETNKSYNSLHKIFNPQVDADLIDQNVQAWIEAHSLTEYQAAFTCGQYTFRDGVYYGGSHRAWSQTVLLGILDHHAGQADQIIVLDIHTGLGSAGVLQPIHIGSEKDFKVASSLFRSPVSSLGHDNISSHNLSGTLGAALSARFEERVSTYVALEVGTRPLETVLSALLWENWHHHQSVLDNENVQAARARLRDAFYPDDHAWRGRAMASCLDFINSIKHHRLRSLLGAHTEGPPQ